LVFHATALHPRLHSAARIRGLRTRQNVGKIRPQFHAKRATAEAR
jgi:hypothetical protein